MRTTNSVNYYGDWGQVQEARVNKAGNITKKVKTVYSSGQCHALALALHELAGLPLVGLYGDGDDFDEEMGEGYSTPMHTAVRLPSGTVLDIKGIDAQLRWRATVLPLSEKEVRGFEKRDYLPPDVEAAKPFAKTLLARYGIVLGNIAEPQEAKRNTS